MEVKSRKRTDLFRRELRKSLFHHSYFTNVRYCSCTENVDAEMLKCL